jgi:transcriptional regulator with XRE-family HTH domain
MQLYEKLRILRRQRHLTQAQLAEQIGCTRSFVASLETNAVHLSVNLAIKLSDFFGVPVDVLIRDELDLDVDNR